MKNKYSEEKMYSLIRQWETSGVSQRKFLVKHHIATSTFAYWRKKYLKEADQKQKKEFIPVKLDATIQEKATATGTLEVVYPNGVRLVCSEGMDLSRLKPLIVL
jgi:hypothetical protein